MGRGGFLVAAREMRLKKENKNTKQSVSTQYTITHLFWTMVETRRSLRISKEATKAEEKKKTKAATNRRIKGKEARRRPALFRWIKTFLLCPIFGLTAKKKVKL
jgi:hypothetical protein